jgi:hypothetical protein
VAGGEGSECESEEGAVMAGWQGEDKNRTPKQKKALALQMLIAVTIIVFVILKLGV